MDIQTVIPGKGSALKACVRLPGYKSS